MELHHETVFDAHACHFGQHLAAEEFLLGGVGIARDDTVEECCGGALRQVGGLAVG